jgi:hypothetical protein
MDVLDHDDIPLVDESDALADPQASVEDAAKVLVSGLQMPNEEVGNHPKPAISVESTPLQNSPVEDANNTTQVYNPVDSKVDNLVVVIDNGENRAQVSCRTRHIQFGTTEIEY